MNASFPDQYRNVSNSCWDTNEGNILAESTTHRLEKCHPFFLSSVPHSPIRRPKRRQSIDLHCMKSINATSDRYCCDNKDKMHSSAPMLYISFYNDNVITKATLDVPPKIPIRMTSESD